MRASAVVTMLAAVPLAAHSAPPVSVVFDEPSVLSNPLLEALDFDLSGAFGFQGVAGLTPAGRVWAGARFTIGLPGGVLATTGVLVEDDEVGIRPVPARVGDSLPPGRTLVSLRPRWFDDDDNIYATGFTLADDALTADGAVFLADAQGGYRVLLPEDFVEDGLDAYATAPSIARVTPDGAFVAIPFPQDSITSLNINGPRLPLIAGDLGQLVPMIREDPMFVEDTGILFDTSNGFLFMRHFQPNGEAILTRLPPPYDTVEPVSNFYKFMLPDGSFIGGLPTVFSLSSEGHIAVPFDASVAAESAFLLVGPLGGPYTLALDSEVLLPSEDRDALCLDVLALSPRGASLARISVGLDSDTPGREILYLHRPAFPLRTLLSTGDSLDGLAPGVTVESFHRAVINDSGVGLILARVEGPGVTPSRSDVLIAITAGPTLSVIAREGAPIDTPEGPTGTLASLDPALGELDNDQLVHDSGRAVFQAVFEDTSAAVLDVRLGSAPCNAIDYAEPFGVLDFSDLFAFLALFAGADPGADLQPDGAFDFLDVFELLTRFSAGCP